MTSFSCVFSLPFISKSFTLYTNYLRMEWLSSLFTVAQYDLLDIIFILTAVATDLK